MLQSIEKLVLGRLSRTDEGRAPASSGAVVDDFCHGVPEFVGGAFVLELVADRFVLKELETFGHQFGLVVEGLGRVAELVGEQRFGCRVVDGLGHQEAQFFVEFLDEVPCGVQSVLGSVLGDRVEGHVVPGVKEAFLSRVDHVELVGADRADGAEQDLEGAAGVVARAGEQEEFVLFVVGVHL